MCRGTVFGRLQHKCAVSVQRVWRGHCSRRILFASLTNDGVIAIAEFEEGTTVGAADATEPAVSVLALDEDAAAPDVSVDVAVVIPAPLAASSAETLLPLESDEPLILPAAIDDAPGDNGAHLALHASHVSAVGTEPVAGFFVDALQQSPPQCFSLDPAAVVASTNRCCGVLSPKSRPLQPLYSVLTLIFQ
jgi:hypothetical protein